MSFCELSVQCYGPRIRKQTSLIWPELLIIISMLQNYVNINSSPGDNFAQWGWFRENEKYRKVNIIKKKNNTSVFYIKEEVSN